MTKDITVVTGFFDIGRSNWGKHPVHGDFSRSVDKYFGYFETLAELKNPMVIVTSEDLADRVFSIRSKFGLGGITNVIVKSLPEHDRKCAYNNVSHIMFKKFVLDNQVPEFKNADYSVVTNQKSQFVVDAIDAGYVQTEQVAWIDFGYCRAPKWFDATQPWRYDFGDKINLWILRNLDDRPIFDVVRLGMIYFMGCHFVGPKTLWHDFNESWRISFNALLECGFTDDDQTTMLMVWRKNPEMFQLHVGQDRGPGSWYFILNEYNESVTKTFDVSVLGGY